MNRRPNGRPAAIADDQRHAYAEANHRRGNEPGHDAPERFEIRHWLRFARKIVVGSQDFHR
jgi:hypothetical protein